MLGLWFVRGLSPVAASGGHSSSRCGNRSSSRCAGLPPSRPLPPRGTGSRHAGSAAVAHGPSRSAACGIPPDQGSNPCPLHWQADSQPLRHQGSPPTFSIWGSCWKAVFAPLLTRLDKGGTSLPRACDLFKVPQGLPKRILHMLQSLELNPPGFRPNPPRLLLAAIFLG